jgi:hypothetical protein
MTQRQQGIQAVSQWSFLLLLASFAAHSSDELIPAELEEISHKIAYVNTFGSWRSDQSQGSFRVIVLDANEQQPHSKIYLQWISSGQNGDEKKDQVIATASIKEINYSTVYKLSPPKIIDSDGVTAIELSAENLYTRHVQNVQIHPVRIGEYKISYTANPLASQVEGVVNKIPAALNYYVRPTF